MNCDDVEPFLDLLASSSSSVEIPDEASVRQHVADCPWCQQSLRSLERWDRQLHHAMNDVVVPVGLANRIVTALEVASPERHLLSRAGSAGAAWRRYRVLGGIGLVGLLLLSLRWFYLAQDSGQIGPANVALLWSQPPEVISAKSKLVTTMPRGWSLLGNMILADWQQTTINTPPLKVAMRPFEMRVQRSLSIEGAIFAMPRWMWRSAIASTVSKSQIHYAADRVWMAWGEGDAVYVVAIRGEPQSMERLQRLLGDGSVVY